MVAEVCDADIRAESRAVFEHQQVPDNLVPDRVAERKGSSELTEGATRRVVVGTADGYDGSVRLDAKCGVAINRKLRGEYIVQLDGVAGREAPALGLRIHRLRLPALYLDGYLSLDLARVGDAEVGDPF